MKSVAWKFLLYAAVVAAAATRAQAPRQPLKVCDCGTSNEADRSTCIGCGASV